jgi:probable rRNA maturation factor
MPMIEVEIEEDGWTTALNDVVALTAAAASAALKGAQVTGDLVVLLTGDETVRDLNARFRGQDQPTNVLSFPAPAHAPLGENDERFLGDIALAFGVCIQEAQAQSKSLGVHLQHLVAHGVLHLVGYDHVSDGEAEVMEALERRILAGLGVADPYAIHDEAYFDRA